MTQVVRRAACGVRRAACGVCGATCVVLLAPVASAQTPPAPPRVEVTVAGAWTGGASAGTTSADLIDPAGGTVRLFEARHRIRAAVGAEAHVAVRWRQRWAFGVTGTFSRADLESRITNDVEGAAPTTAALGVQQYAVEGAAVWRLARRGRVEPYLRAGGGWMRQVTSGRAYLEDGLTLNAASGLKYWIRDGQPGWWGRIALRAEARVVVRRGGISLAETGTRVSPSVVVGLVVAR